MFRKVGITILENAHSYTKLGKFPSSNKHPLTTVSYHLQTKATNHPKSCLILGKNSPHSCRDFSHILIPKPSIPSTTRPLASLVHPLIQLSSQGRGSLISELSHQPTNVVLHQQPLLFIWNLQKILIYPSGSPLSYHSFYLNRSSASK